MVRVSYSKREDRPVWGLVFVVVVALGFTWAATTRRGADAWSAIALGSAAAIAGLFAAIEIRDLLRNESYELSGDELVVRTRGDETRYSVRAVTGIRLSLTRGVEEGAYHILLRDAPPITLRAGAKATSFVTSLSRALNLEIKSGP
jgi:hypothetical protein